VGLITTLEKPRYVNDFTRGMSIVMSYIKKKQFLKAAFGQNIENLTCKYAHALISLSYDYALAHTSMIPNAKCVDGQG
jgi:hypothetical protein